MTIVVLLILAGITISLVFSENGIIAKAQEAAEKTNQSVANEQEEMNKVADYMSNMVNGTSGGSTTPDNPASLPSDGSYSEKKGVNTPNLGTGMTPIKWNGSSWVETTGDDEEWYDYLSKKWANAVVGGNFNEDGTLNQSSNYSMFVWIPRYAYSITSGYHSNNTGTIEIEFMKGTSEEGATGKSITDYATATVNAETTNKFVDEKYVIHPAFNYGETVSGIWVAKFEASPEGATTDVANSEYNGTDKKLQVKPRVSSWRNITISNMYDVCKSYNPTLNSHLMKNDEWGAVAYLSKSKYGKETEEVYINNSSSFITGSAGNIAAAGADTGTTNDYTDSQGVKASTTGNVYGVYDMSGGAWECVAAYVNNGDGNLTNYGSSLISGETKMKNVYSKADEDNNTNNYHENSEKYGDAIYETSMEGDNSNKSWYGDFSRYPESNGPFFIRGGCFNENISAGIFYFNNSNGLNGSNFSFRPVLIAH